MSNSLGPHGLGPWNSPGQNTGLDSLSLLQGIFPIQGLNPGLLHCRQILYQLSHKPLILSSAILSLPLISSSLSFHLKQFIFHPWMFDYFKRASMILLNILNLISSSLNIWCRVIITILRSWTTDSVIWVGFDFLFLFRYRSHFSAFCNLDSFWSGIFVDFAFVDAQNSYKCSLALFWDTGSWKQF